RPRSQCTAWKIALINRSHPRNTTDTSVTTIVSPSASTPSPIRTIPKTRNHPRRSPRRSNVPGQTDALIDSFPPIEKFDRGAAIASREFLHRQTEFLINLRDSFSMTAGIDRQLKKQVAAAALGASFRKHSYSRLHCHLPRSTPSEPVTF